MATVILQQSLRKVNIASVALGTGRNLSTILQGLPATGLQQLRGMASESTPSHNLSDTDAKLPDNPAGSDEPQGEAPGGHGFSDEAGKEREYGKIQEDPLKVAKRTGDAPEGAPGVENETLESTGHDTSKRTTPQGGE